MRMAAMILGILGGAFGIVSGFGAFLMGNIFMHIYSPAPEGAIILEPEGSGMLFAVLGILAILISIAAIVGGALAQRKPSASWIILLLTAISGFATGGIWLIPGILLFAAAIIEFLARKDKQPEAAAICSEQMKI